MGECCACFNIVGLFSQFVEFLKTSIPFAWPFIDALMLVSVDFWRLFSGRWSAHNLEKCKRPKEPLELYEFTGDTDCKVVRETLSVLDIDHMVYPCPLEYLIPTCSQILNSRFRGVVSEKLSGQIILPLLVDKNTSETIAGRQPVVDYLWKTYGSDAVAPWNYNFVNQAGVQAFTLCMTKLCRPSTYMGKFRAPSRKVEKPVELWGYEGSAFVRRVEEILTVCEVPYMYHMLPMGSEAKRQAFRKQHEEELSGIRKKYGLVKVPYLEDPNTDTKMFESSAILLYIQQKYQTGEVVKT